MKRTTVLAGVFLALPILVAGCGGGADSERQAVVDALRSDLVTGGATEEQADCVMTAIDDLSTEDLKVLQVAEATPSPEIQDKVLTALSECAFGG